jgi:hypothetical protein
MKKRLAVTLVLLASLVPFVIWTKPERREAFAAPNSDNPITLDFEMLSDSMTVNNQFSNIGVSFEGATVLGQGASLNYLQFPPHSGVNVIYDDRNFNGTITVRFDSNVTHNVSKVGGYVTGNQNITLTAYDASNNVVGIDTTNGANNIPNGTPNILLEVASNTFITKATFSNNSGAGNTFTVDDFLLVSNQTLRISGVPLYKQGDNAWKADRYGGTTTNPWYDDNRKLGTIGDYGCALTSAAMLISYFGMPQNQFTTTPKLLNDWLRIPENHGYSGGAVVWPAVAQYARNHGVKMYFYGIGGTNNGVVNGYLADSYPVVLSTSSSPYVHGHYVVATGQVDNTAWYINDPGGYNLSQLGTDSYAGLIKYATTPREPKALYIAIHSPVELLITDPAGRTTGYSPDTGRYMNDILDASYQTEVIGTNDGARGVKTRVFYSGSPLSGRYSIQLVGIGNGDYKIDFIAYDANGNSSSKSISGAITAGSRIHLYLDYSNQPGSHVTVATKQFLPLVQRDNNSFPPSTKTPVVPTATPIHSPTAIPTTRPTNTPIATRTSTPTVTKTPTRTPTAIAVPTRTPTLPPPTSTSTPTPGQPPAAPSSLQVAVLSTTQLRLNWNDNSTNETGFAVYDGSNWVANVGANTTSYTVGGLPPNSYHCLTVYAYNNYGNSGFPGWACATTNAPPPIEFVSQIGGFYGSGVAVQGSSVYIADNNGSLRILDVTDPANPREVGSTSLPSQAYAVVVVGSYAYVADNAAGLRIVDISTPSNPHEVGYDDTPGYSYGIAIAGNYAYIADTTAGLRIINIANPASPYEVGSYSTGSDFLFDVAVVGNYAYLAKGSGGFEVVNVANPTAPTHAGSAPTPDIALGVSVVGSYAYVADSVDLRMFNISNPTAPSVVGYYTMPTEARSVTIANNLAYVGNGLNGLRILNVSNPANPQEVGLYDTSGFAQGVAISSNYAYVADGTGGLVILRVNI